MATPYFGFDPYTAPTPTATFGRFQSGNATDDLDLDDAAHLMPLPMAAQDRSNWLGWRVGYLNVVEGSTGNSSLTANIRNYNTWDLRNNWVFTAGQVAFLGSKVTIESPTYVVGGFTLHIGDPTLGPGFLIIDAGSAGVGSGVLARNGAGVVVDGSGGKVRAQNGADIEVGSGGRISAAGAIARTGASATSIGRAEIAAISVTGQQNPLVADTFKIPATTASPVVCTLLAPTEPVNDVTFYSAGGPNNDWALKIVGATNPLLTWKAGNPDYFSITLRYTGTRWTVLSWAGVQATSLTIAGIVFDAGSIP